MLRNALNADQRRALGALARTLFRWDPTLQLDRVEASVLERTQAWLSQGPSARGDALLAALTTFDEGFGAWVDPPGTPFADGTVEAQAAWVDACAHARSPGAREGFEALTSAVLLHYVGP